MEELKECPFCGSSATLYELDKYGKQYYPRCFGINGFCLLSRTPDPENDGFVNKRDAIEVWNKRFKKPE